MNKIVIRRDNLMSGEGTLSYHNPPAVVIETKSWEHAGNLIPAKIYTGCSKTIMDKRGWPAIFIPDDQTCKKGIFIHKGESQSWSDGCICITEKEMKKLLDIVPSENGAITVEVVNP